MCIDNSKGMKRNIEVNIWRKSWLKSASWSLRLFSPSYLKYCIVSWSLLCLKCFTSALLLLLLFTEVHVKDFSLYLLHCHSFLNTARWLACEPSLHPQLGLLLTEPRTYVQTIFWPVWISTYFKLIWVSAILTTKCCQCIWLLSFFLTWTF